MGRFCRFLGLAGLLLAMGHLGFTQQVNTSTGTAVVGNPAVMTNGAPVIITPPAVTLPGSGTPVGAPVQVGVNDPRNPSGYVQESGPMVTSPSVLTITPPSVSVPNAPVSVAGPVAATATNGTSAAANGRATNTGANGASSAAAVPAGFNMGVAGPASMSTSTHGTTVADAAARFKAEKASIRARMITNQDIAALNGRNGNGIGMNANNQSMPQSDVPANQNQSDGSSQGVLDQRDLNAVKAAVARTQAKKAAADKAAADKAQQDNAAQPQQPPKQ
jgi:hypothetical protein